MNTSFLTGKNVIPVYRIQLPYYDGGSGCVMILDQAVYRTRQAHWLFNAGLTNNFASKVEDSLYSMWDGNKFVHINIHVDNSLVISNNVFFLKHVSQSICSLYEVVWHKNPTQNLEVRIH